MDELSILPIISLKSDSNLQDLAHKSKWYPYAPNKKTQISPHPHISGETGGYGRETKSSPAFSSPFTPKLKLSECHAM